MAYLDEHNTRIPQQRIGRRQQPRIIVKHTSEQVADLTGADGGAEALAVAVTTATRPGSYHRADDRDSSIQIVDDANEAFGAKGGYNQIALHSAFALSADKWDQLPPAARSQYITRGAQNDADWCRRYDIPAVKLTRAEVDAGRSGFVGHGDLDPGRRYDPGWNADEWAAYMSIVGQALQGTPVYEVEAPGRYHKTGRWPKWRIYSDGRIVPVNNAPATRQLTEWGIAKTNEPVTDGWYDLDTNSVVLESKADGGTFALQVKA